MRPWILMVAAAAAISQAAPAAIPAELSPATILDNVINRNQDLRSYQATVDTTFRTKSFPWMHIALNGTAYFQAPTNCTVLYKNLPGYMKGFPVAYAAMLDMPAWPEQFVVTGAPARKVNGHTDLGLHLTPRDPNSALDAGDAFVDPTTWEVEQSDWTLQGGKVHFSIVQTFTTIGSFRVLADQQFDIRVPATHAVGTSTFRDYHVNVAINESVFAER
jgi:hypothetical protein